MDGETDEVAVNVTDDDDTAASGRSEMDQSENTCTGENVNLRHDRAWKTINEPVKTIYKNLEKSQQHITSFLNYLLDNKTNLVKFFVPNQKCCKEHYTLMSRNCSVFNFWMFGRLFYILGQSTLQEVHILVVTAQIEIIEMLVTEHPFLGMELVEEYIFCLEDITKYFKENSMRKSYEIKRFIPPAPVIEGIDLDLTPYFVQITTVEESIQIQCHLLELLSALTATFEPRPHTVYAKLLQMVFSLIRTGRIQVQLKAFKFASNAYKLKPFSEYADVNDLKIFYTFLEKVCVNYCDFDMDETSVVNLKEIIKNLFEEIAENVHLYPAVDREYIKATVKNILLQELSPILTGDVSDALNQIIRKVFGGSFDWHIDSDVIEHISKNLNSCKYYMAVLVCSIVKELMEAACIPELDKWHQNLTMHIAVQKKNHLQACNKLERRVIAASKSSTWTFLLKYLESILAELDTSKQLLTEPDTQLADTRLKLALSITSCADEVTEYVRASQTGDSVYFYGDRIDVVVKGLVRVVQLICSCPYTQAQSLMQTVIEMAGMLIDKPELRDGENRRLVSALLIAPWLQQSAVASLLPSGHILDSLQHQLQKLADLQLTKTCISYLAPLELEEAEEWRVELISKLITEGSANSKAALYVVPQLLAAVRPEKAEMILLDLLKPAWECPQLHVDLVKVLPKVLCALSGSCIVQRKMCDGQMVLQLHCTECRSRKGPYTQLNLSTEIATFFAKLIQVATQADSSALRQAVVSALPSLARHFPDGFTHPLGSPSTKWLSLLCDVDSSVRTTLSQHAHHLLVSRNKADLKLLILQFSECIMAAARRSLTERNKSMQESLAFTLKTIGCNVHLEGLLLHITATLVVLALHVNSSCASVSRLCLNAVAKAHHISLQALFTRYRLQLSNVVMMFSVQSHFKSQRDFIATMQAASKLFGFESVQTMLSRECRYLLPFLFSELPTLGEAALMPLLDKIAEQLEVTSKKLVLHQFQYIYPYIIVNESEEVINLSLMLLEKISGSPVHDMISASFKVIHNLLILDYASNQTRVLDSLRYLSTLDPVYKGGSMEMPLENIADFLQPRFLGVLIHFDNSLAAEHVSDTEKKKALQSLPVLMRLMGKKYITLARFKVLTSLRIALRLNYSNFPELTVAAWNAYVHCLEDVPLGALLSTIFVSLLPLMDTLPKEVLTIFQYLVVDKQDELSPYFKELHFIPECDELKFVLRAVKRYNRKTRLDHFVTSLSERLTYARYEIIDVRLEGLRNLKVFIQQNRANINEAVVAKEKVDRSIIELVRVLMDACHDPDETVRLAAGACVGELGAIDPGIMPTREPLQNTGCGRNFPLDVDDDNFAVQAITELAKGFQKSKVTQNVDGFSYSIQELLKIYHITENSPLWNKFSSNVQDIMRPLLKSSYKSVLKRPENFPCPIYGSKYGRSLHTWVYCWAFKMINFINGGKCRKIFDACALVVKKDLTTGLYFLPYILLHSLITCSETEREMILREVKAVVANPLPQEPVDPLEPQTVLLKPRKRLAGQIQGPREQEHIRVCRVVYSLLDFLAHWMHDWYSAHTANHDNSGYNYVSSFLEEIPKLSISKGNFVCREYACALKYLEAHIKNHPNELQANLSYLEEIYANLNDPDGVAGTLAIQGKEPSLYQTLRAHEVMGRLQEASACYEKMAQDFYIDAHNLKGIVKCYLRLDQPFIAMKITEGVTTMRPELEQEIFSEKAEIMWRLGQYDALENFVSRTDVFPVREWGVQVGKAISLMRQPSVADSITSCFHNIRGLILDSICETVYKHGAYRHAYNKIVELHILHEMEQASVLIQELSSPTCDKKCAVLKALELFSNWDARFRIVQRSFHVAECVLRIRRTLLGLVRDIAAKRFPGMSQLLDREVGNCWLQSARAARKGNHHQQAYTYLLSTEKYKVPSLLLEKVKLHWAKGDHESAFHVLKCAVFEDFPEAQEGEDQEMASRRIIHAKALLLYALYNDDMVKVDTEQSVLNYNKALNMHSCWEKGYVSLARFYDRVLQNFSELERDTKGGDVQLAIVNCYGSSLKYGCKYIYQSMPRMLTLWLDYGSSSSGSSRGDPEMSAKMTELVVKVTSVLPPYMLMTALSQLISRVCHQNSMVVKQLKAIIVRVLTAYPHYVLWMLMAPLKSSYAVRAKRCNEILHDEKVAEASLTKIVRDYILLTDLLIELTNKPIGEVSSITVTDLVPQLNKLLKSENFSKVIVPTQKYLNFVLPTDASKEHNPFPKSSVHISYLQEKVLVLQSMQKPRRVTLVGSDGENYTMLCKPKDDLRKDFRLMEFNGIVNKYLKKDPDSRQRALRVRTYAVVPLNEECGIIEWVPDLVGMRPMLNGLYKRMGIGPSQRILKELLACKVDQVSRKKMLFEKLLNIHPPVLSVWFLQTFPDPSSWYQARTTYVRTCAVMSMVGYILGLGDRHGENVLLDCSSGGVVHVDFNCLFNKGENFDCPEVVPFRLTHNMVSAMGPLGVEGPFRRACEITLRLMRTKSDTLMCVLRPFVYDPIISWKNKSAVKKNEEMTNERAVQHLMRIEQRLKGVVRSVSKPYSFPLSVEGQANSLILEATSIDNLCRMYVGWGPYL